MQIMDLPLPPHDCSLPKARLMPPTVFPGHGDCGGPPARSWRKSVLLRPPRPDGGAEMQAEASFRGRESPENTARNLTRPDPLQANFHRSPTSHRTSRSSASAHFSDLIATIHTPVAQAAKP